MTIDRSAIKQALETSGESPVESVEPRLARIEARLMRAMAPDATDEEAVIVAFRPRRRMSSARRLVVGAVAASLLAVVVLAAGWFSSAEQSLVMATADDVTVVFPDGSTASGESGLALPVGAEVEVGGSMVIDGVTYGPGSYTITDDGVEADDLAAVVTSEASGRGSEVAPPITAAEPTPTSTSPPTESDVTQSPAPPRVDDDSTDPVPESSVPRDVVDRPSDREDREGQPDVGPATTAPPEVSTSTARPTTTTTTMPNDRPTTTVEERRPTDRSGETDGG